MNFTSTKIAGKITHLSEGFPLLLDIHADWSSLTSPSIYQFYFPLILGIYFDFAAALLQILGGTKIYIYSNTAADELLNDNSALIICNHRSLVDW